MATVCRDWLNTQWQPSFKTIPFDVDQDVRSGGRRIVVHEFPSAERWLVEDLGRKQETVLVTGYVHGDNVDFLAQMLLEACASPGPGELFLPMRPPSQAHCQSVSSTFTKDELGRIAIDMEFVYVTPPGNRFIPKALLANAVHEAVKDAIAIVKQLHKKQSDSLMAKFASPVSIVPAAVRDSAAETIALVGAAVTAAKTAVPLRDAKAAARAELVGRRIGQSAPLFAYHGRRAAWLETDVRTSDELEVDSGFADLFVKGTQEIADAAADSRDLAAAMKAMAAFRAQPITINIDALSVNGQKALTAGVADFVRRIALLRWAEATSMIKFGFRSEAVTMRADLDTAFLTEIALIDDPDVERAMFAARDAAVECISRTAADLPADVALKLNRPLPAALIAYRLYGDATRDEEIIERNAITHPLYSPLRLTVAAR